MGNTKGCGDAYEGMEGTLLCEEGTDERRANLRSGLEVTYELMDESGYVPGHKKLQLLKTYKERSDLKKRCHLGERCGK